MQRNQNRTFLQSVIVGISIIVLPLVGCSRVEVRQPNPPVKIVVAPVLLEAAITKSTQIHSFEEDPVPEQERVLFPQLKDEVQVRAHRLLIEHLAPQEGVTVIPFEETRRMVADLGPAMGPWTEEQMRALGQETGADFVLSGKILDYGVVRWQYWVTGMTVQATTELLITGFATGWNPAAVGAWVAFDLTTDLPMWSGGAYVFGWAFRPVRVQLEAVQLKECEGLVWSGQELVVKVSGKTLAEYPPEEQKRKEVQLEVNLNRAMAEIAETVGRKLVRQPCGEDGVPQKIGGSSAWQLLDLLY